MSMLTTCRAFSFVRRCESTAYSIRTLVINRPEVSRPRLQNHRDNLKRGDMKLALQRFNDENKYVHQYVHDKFDKFRSQSAIRIDSAEISELLNQLAEFTAREHPDELAYKEERSNLFKLFKSATKKMSLKELASLLTTIKDSTISEFRVVKRMIDVGLKFRLKVHKIQTSSNELDLLFYFADTFYQCSHLTTFVPDLIDRLAKRDYSSLSDKQLMYMLFLIILERDHKGILQRFEERFLKLLESATIEEVCTICLSYFKTMSPILNSRLQEKIIHRTIKLLPSIDHTQPGYCAVIKSLRYSHDLALRDDVVRLVNKVSQDPSCAKILDNLFNLTHTAKLMETFRIYDPEMLERLGKSISEKIDELRIKDIQYLLTSLSNFKWRNLELDDSLKQQMDTLCQTIATESRSDAKYQDSHILPLIRALLTFGYYNDQLIDYTNRVLEDSEKVQQLRSKVFEFDRSALLAYVATRLESPGAKLQIGDDLLSDMSASIRRVGSTGSVKNDSSIGYLNFLLHPNVDKDFYKSTTKMRSIAKELSAMDGLNSDEFHHHFQFTMAHQNYADLVVSLDQPAPGSFDPSTKLPRLVALNQKHCLVFAVHNLDFMDSCDRLSGFKQLMMRLCIRLGYRVVPVNLDKPNIAQLSRQIRSVLIEQDPEGDSATESHYDGSGLQERDRVSR